MLALLCLPALAQLSNINNVVNYTPPRKLTIKPGATVDSTLKLTLRPGYHVNTNMPSDEYLIPLRLTWNTGAVESSGVVFPAGETRKYSFSQKPLSVYTGDFELVTHFKAAANAEAGTSKLTGKLRYQACNDSMCLPPKTLEVSLDVEVAR
jgi:hypothetical protein